MKRIFSIITATFLILSVFSAASVFAAEECVVNKNAKLKVGDKFTYTLNLSDTEENIIGFELRLYYDDEYLKIDNNSFKFPKFDNVFKNTNIKGEVPINWTNIYETISFSKKDVFLSVDFEVIKAGNAKISYFVTDIYGDDMTYLKKYKWTSDITSGKKELIKDETPIVDKEHSHKQGSYINYEDGMGEQNSPNSDNHVAETGTMQSLKSSEANHVGETYNYYATDIQEVTRFVERDGEGGKTPVMLYVGIGVVVAAVLVGGAIFLSKKKK